ncbi:hypothetical protein DFP72DRAFT_898713 [Ephemerocybe angulata]|uniref:Uncharacterized protein n=1 Tax=Ephemerocybe angulata TaxID=980116 RepID=A0A8H6HX04_9AGAR|nr:hypothetical protein DFP72DRAFT_898713 [Tulosesus angulatus]
MSTPTHEKLQLDPGTVKRRRTSVNCKCLLVSGGIFAGLLAVLGIAKIAVNISREIRSPHAFMYENRTIAEVQGAGEMAKVVRPLVDERQKFDVRAKVWSTVNGDGGLKEVWDGVLFKGVTLQDKHVHTKVGLSVPLEGFKKDILENYDLRAYLTIIPHEPSLLDYMDSFETWKPTLVTKQNISPLAPGEVRTTVNEALDSFGISIPLIDFHPIKSTCGGTKATQTSDNETESGESTEEETFHLGKSDVETTKGRKVLKAHPYVVTRTDFRVAKMTKLYNLKEYERHQELLRKEMTTNGCLLAQKLNMTAPQRDERNCYRTFSSRANCETLIRLLIPTEKSGEKKPEAAYAPFIDVTPRNWGPLDLVPIPVDREHCAHAESSSAEGVTVEEQKYLNVTWNVAYSASSPAKLFIADTVGRFNSGYNTTDTEFQKARMQQIVEQRHRLHGQKFSPYGRRGRNRVLHTVGGIANFIHINLSLLYWYTRSSTVGISIIGASIQAGIPIVDFTGGILASKAFESDTSLPAMLITVIVKVYRHLAVTFVVLKAILRVDFLDSFPFLAMMPASHLERASLRLEIRGQTKFVLGILIASFSLYLASPLRKYPLIAHVGPAPDIPDTNTALYSNFQEYALLPLELSAFAFQLLLNCRAKTFAGQYKLAAWLGLIEFVCNISVWLPGIRGEDHVRPAFTVGDLVIGGVTLGWAVQAWLYPRVEQDVGEDKDMN